MISAHLAYEDEVLLADALLYNPMLLYEVYNDVYYKNIFSNNLFCSRCKMMPLKLPIQDPMVFLMEVDIPP